MYQDNNFEIIDMYQDNNFEIIDMYQDYNFQKNYFNIKVWFIF